jgi:tetratricopeptide (TPR) repeat protein
MAGRHDMKARQQGLRALIEIYASRGRLREAGEAAAAFPGPMPKGAARAILRSQGAGFATRANFDRAVETLALQPGPVDHFLLGALAAREGRWEDFDREIAALEGSARDAPTATSSTQRKGQQQLLRGLAASIRGDRRSAIQLLEDVLPRISGGSLLRYELAKLWLAEGDPRRATGYLESIEYLTPALNAPVEVYLGKAYEALGDVDRARLHYARFVSWWQDCDPELEPMRAEGRQALDRLIARHRG